MEQLRGRGTVSLETSRCCLWKVGGRDRARVPCRLGRKDLRGELGWNFGIDRERMGLGL